MKATDIRVGGIYGATTYGKPRVDRRIRQYKVIREIPTSGGRQTKFEVKCTGTLDGSWNLEKREDGPTRTLKSGNFLMPWSQFEKAISAHQKREKEYQKERRKREEEEEKQKQARREVIREVAKLTGVLLFDPDSGNYRDKYNLTGNSCEIQWEQIEKLLGSLKVQKVIMQEATQDAMDILGDVF